MPYDVILYAPNGFRLNIKNFQLPFGLIALSGCLKKAEFSVNIVNEATIEQSLKKIMSSIGSNTLFIGLTCMTGSPIYDNLAVSQNIREKYPDLPLVWGGAHPTSSPEQTLKHPLVDIIVRGPGEKTVVELAKALKSKKSLEGIKGLSFKKNGEIIHNSDRELEDINNFPMFDYDALDMKRYMIIKKDSEVTPEDIATRYTGYFSSRGCVHRCGFCSTASDCHRGWQAYKPERVVKELKILKKKYNLKGIVFADENFFVSKERAEKIFDLMIKEKMNLKWSSASCRVNYFANYDDAFIEKMKKSGCVSLHFGAESGSQRMLDFMRKDITIEQIIETTRKCKKHGIKAKFYFMMGLPTETVKDLYRTVDLMLKINKIFPDKFEYISIFTPFAGTYLMNYITKNGFKPPASLEEWGKYNYLTFSTPWGGKKFRDTVKVITMLSQFLAGYHYADRGLKIWQRLIFLLLKIDAKFRFKRKLFSLAPEWKMVKKYLDKYIEDRSQSWMIKFKDLT